MMPLPSHDLHKKMVASIFKVVERTKGEGGVACRLGIMPFRLSYFEETARIS